MWEWLVFGMIVLIIVVAIFVIRRNKKQATDEPASVSDILINSLDEID